MTAALLAAALAAGPAAPAREVYRSRFDRPAGTTFPEWAAGPVRFHQTVTGGRGERPGGPAAVAESAGRRRRFLGEFGGPPVGAPGDPDWNRTRVEQAVTLTLAGLPPHARVRVGFDLLVLRSWDGDSSRYGPDRFTVRLAGGTPLFAATFSNNPKVPADGSTQGHPAAGSPPGAGAFWRGDGFFRDAGYRLSVEARHRGPGLAVEFESSLFEGKGTADEAWGLGEVVVWVSGAGGI